MGAPVRRLIALLVVLAALAIVGSASAATPTVRLAVRTTTATHPLPTGFLGLALEFGTIPEWAGNGSQPVNPVLVQLIRNLNPTGSPNLRIGGQSTDRSWWPVKGMARPLGVTANLTNGWVASARALVKALNAKLLLGVNYEADSTRITHVEATHLVNGIGSSYIDALEIGNEPSLYHGIPWYKVENGHPLPWYSHTGTHVYSRPASWDPAMFVGEIGKFIASVPHLPIAGPEAGPPWVQAFTHLLSHHSRVRMLTSHAYGLNQCIHNPSLPQYPSVPHLLSQTASRSLASGIKGFISLAHRDGATYRIDEMGSVSCNGRAGVSNTMASALWAADALFSLARTGVDGVNLHSYPNSTNGLFDFTNDNGHWRATVHPLYYGALLFSEAAPAGSQQLRISGSQPSTLRVWATKAPDGHVRVLIINDSLSNSGSVAVQAPSGFGSAPGALERLAASSAYATGGISLGSQSFGNTTTGVLAAPTLQQITPSSGAYDVTVPRSTAALLTLSSGS